ncbi:MAG: antitoxin VapB family protein [Natrialbaceae archaeon]|nr:antitoxin VapB family protein [Natrialbaceae archaeon]
MRTISLADDAYEQLKAEKQEGVSFSDVVRRLTEGVSLDDYYGVLGEETGEQLEAAIDNRRRERTEESHARVHRIADALE